MVVDTSDDLGGGEPGNKTNQRADRDDADEGDNCLAARDGTGDRSEGDEEDDDGRAVVEEALRFHQGW